MSPNVVGLPQVDEALLEQLEDGEEVHDHLESFRERRGQFPERHATSAGQLDAEVGHRVDDAGTDGGHVEQIDPGLGSRRGGACECVAQTGSR